jgi:hypothetical protein
MGRGEEFLRKHGFSAGGAVLLPSSKVEELSSLILKEKKGESTDFVETLDGSTIVFTGWVVRKKGMAEPLELVVILQAGTFNPATDTIDSLVPDDVE